jgi:signal transduction histidine kinase
MPDHPQPADFHSEGEAPHPIPSPTFRLGVGLGIILSTFLVFAVYATHQVRWLENFQTNVVQRNRKASLQLLRLQNDAYLLALSLRDMARAETAYPVREWKPEFARLESDMEDALRRESEFAVSTPIADQERAQLRIALQQFAAASDQVFSLAANGDEAKVREAARAELEPRRVQIAQTVIELLRLNDRAQDEAADRINAVYAGVKRDIFLLIALLFLLALGTGLYTFRANRRTFDRLRDLTERLSLQSAQLRKLSWKLIEVQEDTLRQVSRDLHDEFGQILTGVGLMLRRVGKKAGGGDPGLTSELEAVKQVAEETLQRVRDQSQMFRPAVLDDFGLEQTLEWLARVFEKRSGMTVHFLATGSESALVPEESIHVYRIVQEALSNAARHARAQQAWVKVEGGSGELGLEIRDDGAGFDVARTQAEGLGLMGMRERAEHLEGTFEVDSEPGRGTTIRVRIPLRHTKPLPGVAERVM